MKEKSYGSFRQITVHDDVDRHAEEISLKGFTIVTGLFTNGELETWRDKIDKVYAEQEAAYGRDRLERIQEVDMCRMPLRYDFDFIQMATHSRVLEVVERILGDWFILNLQNAIINRPGTHHHQSSWHRDLPYQNFVISQPLAINALFAIDDFSPETGGTQVVPFTHRTEILPSDDYIEANRIVASAPAGSAILFDSMLFHRAGNNTSPIVRRAVNHLYTKPIIKPQYDFPRALGEQQHLTPAVSRLLGYDSQVPIDDMKWRDARSQRLD